MPFPDKNVSVIADELFQHYLITGTNSIHAQLAQKGWHKKQNAGIWKQTVNSNFTKPF